MNRKQYITESTIKNRVRELARYIDTDYNNLDDRICIVGVLRGAFIFLADLSRLLDTRHTIDFISIGSYDKDNSGNVRLLMDTRTDVSGKHVLIVEDIIDSGKTINYLVSLFLDRNIASVKTCTLFRKNGSKETSNVDYVGFDVPKEHWLIGYGLDFDDKYRTLPDVEILEH